MTNKSPRDFGTIDHAFDPVHNAPERTDQRAGEQASYPHAAQQLFNETQAAAYLAVKKKTMQNWRWQGDGPLFVKLGGGKLVRYRRCDLDSFINSGLRTSTSDEGERNE